MRLTSVRKAGWLLMMLLGGPLHAGGEPGPDQPVMGGAEDTRYADQLWQVMSQARLVGQRQQHQAPFFGGAKPHGMVLELAHQLLTVGNHQGFVVVKKNYDGEGVSVPAVAANRARFLSSITVMYQREPGYDEANQNWFWAKYKPDGSLYTTPADVLMAGRIKKGKSWEESGGCIYCHASAGGGDYIFYPEIQNPNAR